MLGFPALLRSQSPNSLLNVAVIGCGGRGASNMAGILGENIVALCDVNELNLKAAAIKNPNAKQFRDFRKFYDTMRDSEFDAVLVSTTEHTHAFATLPALLRKKHVYCEKPLSRDVFEARTVAEAALKAGVATQMGTQVHASANYRRVVELIQGNAIGTVREAHVWVNRTWGWQSDADAKANGDRFSTQERPTEAEPVPAELDWDLWIGPAPKRPYHDIYFPGPRWYRYWSFANGTMSDLGSHSNDLPFWALKLDHPLTVEGYGAPPHPEIAPANMRAIWTYGQRGDLAPVTHHWYQGSEKPKIWTEGKIPQWKDGCLFIGERGMVIANYGGHLLLLDDKVQEFKRPAKTIEDGPSHQQQFIECARAGKKAPCDFSYSGLLTIANHLGGVSYRSGKKIIWDPVTGKTDDAGANALLQREYRAGWKLS